MLVRLMRRRYKWFNSDTGHVWGHMTHHSNTMDDDRAQRALIVKLSAVSN